MKATKGTPIERLPLYTELSLVEIAKRIEAHLTRFENDPKINAPSTPRGTTPYYHVSAYQSANRLAITYIGYQHTSKILKADAIYYLQRLDKGFVGRHHEALRERDGGVSTTSQVDGRLRCRVCGVWMRRGAPTEKTPNKRRPAPNAGTCTKCPIRDPKKWPVRVRKTNYFSKKKAATK